MCLCVDCWICSTMRVWSVYMITLVCYLSILTAILVQLLLICVCVCVLHKGVGLYMSSILMSSQHAPIKLHYLLPFPLLVFQSVWPVAPPLPCCSLCR